MSRFEIRHKDKGLAFGNDNAMGEFLQIWDLKKGTDPDDDCILVDEDNMTGFTREKLLAHLEQHGFTLAELEAEKLGGKDLQDLVDVGRLIRRAPLKQGDGKGGGHGR